jgi:hypothetical protein
MKTLSPRSWRVIALGSGHAVHHARLELVIRELRLLIDHLAGASAALRHNRRNVMPNGATRTCLKWRSHEALQLPAARRR